MQTKEKRSRPRMRFMLGGIMGALTMYMLDPDRGKRRRHMTRDKIGSISRKLNRRIRSESEHVKGRAVGVVQETLQTEPPDNPLPDDNTLRDRVESEVLRKPDIPKGNFNINVASGIVELRGEVDSEADVKNIERRVRDIPDVLDVHNYLHTPGTPAPNKEAALEAS